MTEAPSAPASPDIAQPTRLGRSNPGALVALCAANVVPLVGVLFFGWSAFSIAVLYWAETAVIGVFTVLKLLVSTDPKGPPRLFLAPFFCVHFGMFMFVHGVFLVFMLGVGALETHSGPTEAVEHLTMSLTESTGMLLALSGFFMSHGVSFVTNFLGAGEFRTLPRQRIMFAPYPRVIVMHVSILLGGMLVTILGAPAVLVALLVVVKTVIDLRAHRRERAHVTGPMRI